MRNPASNDERDRLNAAYADFASDPRRQRAWSADNRGNVAIREEVATGLAEITARPLADGCAVLDVGCGSGYWLERLARNGIDPARLHGVDLVDERVAAAKRRVQGAYLQQADARDLPFADGQFGVVLVFTVLSSQATDSAMRATLREARRVCARGGVVVVWDIRRHSHRRAARPVAASLLLSELGDGALIRSVTLLPPLARKLGRATPSLYPLLLRLPALRTHWLAWNDSG